MSPFVYRETGHQRRHGPRGYRDVLAYRPWLRDGFDFRCVFCLIREQWGRVTGEFDVEHFRPQARNPGFAADYDNLLYACRRCNAAKGDQDVPDPCDHLTSEVIRVRSDGRLETSYDETSALIEKIGLNSPAMIQWRVIWMRNVELALQYDEEHFIRLMQFPDAIPHLARLRPPDGNSRPEGIEESYWSRRARGELPETY